MHDVMAWLYLHPEAEYSTVDLARLVGLSQATVSREAGRLLGAGSIEERRLGRSRHIRATSDTILTRPLTDVLAATFGPLPIPTELLADVTGVTEAYIDGSWAARFAGETGSVPRDIDVLVVGDAYPDDVYMALPSGRAAASSL